jgi:peptidoglycan/xylan/chitin deacetylase (PgdA/CDA1 family)
MITIVPTIDVEAIRSLSVPGDFERLVMGEIKGHFYGVPKIMEILSRNNGKATFFVDYAEHIHGIEKLTSISQYIKAQNFDVQLHIHPQFISGDQRFLLHEYSFEEQQYIFNRAVEIYGTCNGKHPLFFRAGGYGADENTLIVAKEYGIVCDSSYFPGHKGCKLQRRPMNVISYANGMYSFPITVFNNKIHYYLFGLHLATRILLKKTDLNSCSLAELKAVFNRLCEKKDQIMDLFMHSYSLIEWTYDYRKYKPNFREIDKLSSFLEYAKQSGASVISLEQLYPDFFKWSDKETFIPEINTNRKVLAMMLQLFKNNFRRITRSK